MGSSLWPRCLGYKCRPKGVLNLCDSIVVQGPAASPGSLLKMQTVRSLTNLLNQSLHFKRWILVDISPPSCPPYVVLVYAIKRPDSCCPPTSVAGAILRACVSLRRCQGVWALCSAILLPPASWWRQLWAGHCAGLCRIQDGSARLLPKDCLWSSRRDRPPTSLTTG